MNSYFSAQLHAGHTPQDITEQLRIAGWSDDQITAAFEQYKSQMTLAASDNATSDQEPAAPAQLPTPVKRGKLKTGWLLFKQSLAVIKLNPGLSRYVVMTMLWSIGIFGVFTAVLIFDGMNSNYLITTYIDADGAEGFNPSLLGFVVFGVFGFIGTFTTYFYGAALSSHVLAIFRGKSSTYDQHIARAKTRIPAIAVYALISTVVGYILQLLEERLKFVGWIISRILGALWTLATSFVLPIIADSEESGTQSIKNSVSIFKKTWGETIVSRVSLGGLVGLIYILVAVPVTIGLALGLGSFMGVAGLFIALGVFMLGTIILSVLGSLATGILNVSLYYYAQYGLIPPSFSPELLAGVFVAKKAKKQK